VAIAATWVTVSTMTAVTSSSVWTSPATGYQRDLVLTNGAAGTCYVSAGPNATAAATASSFEIPAGGTLVLTASQLPAGSKIWAMTNVAGPLYIGYGTNVSVI
jgi:hypothetical protein